MSMLRSSSDLCMTSELLIWRYSTKNALLIFLRSLSSKWFAIMTKNIRNKRKLLRSLLDQFRDQRKMLEHSSISLFITKSSLSHLQSLRHRYLSYFERISSSHDHWNDRALWTSLNDSLRWLQSSFHSIFHFSSW